MSTLHDILRDLDTTVMYTHGVDRGPLGVASPADRP